MKRVEEVRHSFSFPQFLAVHSIRRKCTKLHTVRGDCKNFQAFLIVNFRLH